MMDNMKDKFAKFSVISIILVNESMTLFTRLVDGYYELKNVLSIIINYICLFDYLFISSQMSAKPYFIGSTGILLLW